MNFSGVRMWDTHGRKNNLELIELFSINIVSLV
jgi:hypothetical protein